MALWIRRVRLPRAYRAFAPPQGYLYSGINAFEVSSESCTGMKNRITVAAVKLLSVKLLVVLKPVAAALEEILSLWAGAESAYVRSEVRKHMLTYRIVSGLTQTFEAAFDELTPMSFLRPR